MGFHNGNGSSGKTRAALPPDVLAAIAARVAVLTDASAGPTACHRWLGSMHPRACGWPRVHFAGRSWSVRQLQWLIAHGTLPARVYRTCDGEPSCVNQRHMTLENPRKKPPQPPRPPRWQKKLSVRRVKNLRRARAHGVRVVEMARRHNVDESTISRALRGETWKWVT